MKHLLILCFILFGIAHGQPITVRRCYESLDAWSGDFLMIDYVQGTREKGYVFYNRTEQRIHYVFDIRGETTSLLRFWLFYETFTRYEFDENTRKCTKGYLPDPSIDPFPTFGVPEKAEFIHQDRLGSYVTDLGVTTDYFRMNEGNDGIYQGYYAPLKFDQSVCVPVIESYENIDKVSSYQKNTHYTYMNITTDPINPYVWIIPVECRNT